MVVIKAGEAEARVAVKPEEVAVNKETPMAEGQTKDEHGLPAEDSAKEGALARAPQRNPQINRNFILAKAAGPF